MGGVGFLMNSIPLYSLVWGFAEIVILWSEIISMGSSVDVEVIAAHVALLNEWTHSRSVQVCVPCDWIIDGV